MSEEGPTARANPAARPTEGGVVHSVANKSKLSKTHSERKRGRPKGSKNKPKALITKEVASQLLGVVKQTLPPELYEEMKQAVRSGKNISTVNEAKILMKLMGPPVWQRLIEEADQKVQPPRDFDPDLEDEIDMQPEQSVTPFNKDLNERIKVYIGLMQFVDKMERNDSDESDTDKKPVLEIFARKGVDGGRVDLLLGYQPGSMGGNADGTERETIEVGAIPDKLPERPLDVQDSEQVPTVRVLDPDSTGDMPQGSDES
jgi:hypothetical protein